MIRVNAEDASWWDRWKEGLWDFSGSWFLNKSWVASFDWQGLGPPTPQLLGLIDGLMVSTGEIGSWLLYLDKILDPSPSSISRNCESSEGSTGERGKKRAEWKPKSKDLASKHLTEWVDGNKWLSFDRSYIHLFSGTAEEDTRADLRCTLAAPRKWKHTSG